MKNLLVIMGGSGTGKTTVARKLEEYGYCRLVTTTTRPRRKGEIDGVSYHFVTEEEFQRIPKVEWAMYAGNFYGLSMKEIEEKGKRYDNLVVVLEKKGAENVKKIYGELVTVVFLRISKEEMERRLSERGDTQENIQARIQHAVEQGEFEPPKFADLVVENKNLEETVKTILEHQKKKPLLGR